MSDLRGWLAVRCADAFAGWFKDLLFSLGNLLVTNYLVFVCGHFPPSATAEHATFDWPLCNHRSGSLRRACQAIKIMPGPFTPRAPALN